MAQRQVCWLWLMLLLFGVACEPESEAPRPEVLLEAPSLSASPEPGSYPTYSLKVRISSSDEEALLFYALNAAPTSEGDSSAVGSFEVALTTSTQIQVRVVKDDRSWGPYAFEYNLTGPEIEDGAGGCSVSSLSKHWHNETDSIVVDVSYQFPVALSRLFLVVDGVDTLLEVPQLSTSGVESASLGGLGEGGHTVACKITARNVADIIGDAVAFGVDTVYPAGGWLSSGGIFTRENWPGYFQLQASDGGSGLASVEVCDTTHVFCMPATAIGGDVFAYATALTSQALSGGTLAARVLDNAGNASFINGIGIDLSGFAEPAPPPARPITMTTEASLPADLLEAGVNEICDLTLTTCYTNPSNVQLVNGWNDFLYRQAGRSEWQSLGVYRAGVRALLPPSASDWLIYETGRPPGFQSSLVAVTAGANEWRSAWFEVPHLFFIEDVNANRRWDEYDNLFTIPTDDFSEPMFASETPVVTSPVELDLAPREVTMTVTVSCPGDCVAPGRLFLDGRTARYGAPITHVDLGGPLDTPVTVPMTAGEFCTFFWDENGDGVVGGKEPRSIAQCESTPVLARQKEALAWVKFEPMVFSAYVTGVPFGGRVERTIRHFSSSGMPLITRPWPPLFDTRGDGMIVEPLSGLSNGFPLEGHVEFRVGSQVTSVTLAATTVASQPYEYQVEVSDESAVPVAALVRAELDGARFFGVAEPSGLVTIKVPAGEPFPSFSALRDGFLSVSTQATGAMVSVRLLSPAVTGQISGTVVDSYGVAVSGAAVSWSAPPYHGETFSGPDGSYAVPASGGVGMLSISAPGRYERSASYALDVTRTTVVKAAVLPADEAVWPYGPHLGYAPAVTGDGVLRMARGEAYYAAEISGSSNLTVDWLGLSRTVDPGGFLPAAPGTFDAYISAQEMPFMQALDSRVTCGARFQKVIDSVFIDSSCWRWTGTDNGREYYFGRLSPSFIFPPVLGLGRFDLIVSRASGTPADQTLYFHDELLGQTLAVGLKSGAASAYLPFGVYRVTTASGTYLRDAAGREAVFSIAENYPLSVAVSIPE